MTDLKERQYVSFTRAHDRVHVLEGYVDSVKGDEVLVETEPDGVLVWARTDDVKVIADPRPAAEVSEVKSGEEKKPEEKTDEPATAEPAKE